MSTDPIRLSEPEPHLAPPGAGLPLPELWIARMMFARFRRRHDRQAAAALIASEEEKIASLVNDLGESEKNQRVLIARLRGLEDSSRFWSINMVLDHLRIVNLGIAGTIRSLGRGIVPDRATSTADVKPDPSVGFNVAEDFHRTCEMIRKMVNTSPDLAGEPKYAHPWFGDLDAAGWHALTGFHMRLHRKQIERILKGASA